MQIDLINFLYLIIFVLIALAFYIKHKLSFWQRQGVPVELTLVYKAIKSQLRIVDKECVKKHGKVFGTYELLTPVLVVSDPDLIGKILIKDFSKFSDHRRWAVEGQMGARCVFASDYKEWKNQRSILAPAFTTKKLKSLKPIVNKAVDKLIDKFDSVAKSGKQVDVIDYYKEFTLNTIICTALGVEIDCLSDPNNKIMQSVVDFFDIKRITFKHIVHLMSYRLAKLFDIYFLSYESISYLYKVLEKVIKVKKSEKSSQYDFINLMLEAEAEFNGPDQKKKLTETEIKDNALAFVLGGYETIMVILSKISYLLAVHPSVQEKLINEIDEISSKNNHSNDDSDNSDVSWDDLANMTYLDAVFHEALRIMPPAPRIERRVPQDTYLTDTPYGDIFMPKDSFVCVSTLIHNDPDYWTDPDTFNPDRFLPENKHLIHPYAHFPFALGPRNCIGYRFALMEIKQCLFKVLKNYKFEVSEGTKIPLEFTEGLVPFIMPKDVTLKIVART